MGIFAIIGAIWLVGYLWKLFEHLYALAVNKWARQSLAERYGKGSYVLITGASDGLGKAFAFEVAQRGFNLILVARNQAKLDSVKAEIKKATPGVKIETFIVDFSTLFQANPIADLQKFASSFDISIVINNVGTTYNSSYKYPGLASKDTAQMVQMISVNILSQSLVHMYFGKQLAARARRTAFLDVGSVAQDTASVWHDIYGATKAFNGYLTESLLNSRFLPNTDQFIYTPGIINTSMSVRESVRDEVLQSSMIGQPRECAASALNALGVIRGTYGSFSFLSNRYVLRFMALFERFSLMDKISAMTMNKMLKID